MQLSLISACFLVTRESARQKLGGVASVTRRLGIVRDHDHRLPLAGECSQQGQHLLTGGPVQIFGRLVG
jgi:hypothetical protein